MNPFAKLRKFLNRRRHHAVVGEKSYIDPTAQMIGSKRIRIGRQCAIGEHTWLNVNDWNASGYAIEIEEYSFIARRNFFTAGAHIRVGAFCLTGPDCHFLGADHAFDDPMRSYMIAPVITDGKIDIGVNCWFGARATVLKNVRIGHGSIIGACAMVTRSVPPFSIVIGSPAQVVKRYRFSEKRWVPIAEWKETDEQGIPKEEDYLKALRNNHPHVRLPLPACSHRFGHC